MQFLRNTDRPIYMDGRPHPPEWAPHTWAGFSTGKYDGNMLVVTTTHLRESYIRANTALFSEKAKVTEYLMLDGDLLTVTTLLEDPAYMEEPHIQSISYRRNLHQELPFFPMHGGRRERPARLPAFPARQEPVPQGRGRQARRAASKCCGVGKRRCIRNTARRSGT